MLDIVLSALNLCFILATGLPFIRSEKWWIRMFDFPRAQVALGGLLSVSLSLGVGNTGGGTADGLLALLALCVLYQGYRMFAYTILAPRQVLTSNGDDPAVSFSLLISSVLRDNRNVGRYLGRVSHLLRKAKTVMMGQKERQPDGRGSDKVSALSK